MERHKGLVNQSPQPSRRLLSSERLATVKYQEAVAIYREIRDTNSESALLLPLAALLGQEKRLNESIAASKRAMTLYREAGDLHSEGVAMQQIAMATLQAHQLDDSVSASRAALAIFQEAGDSENQIKSLIHLGMALEANSKFDEAAAVGEEFAAILEDIGGAHAFAQRVAGRLNVSAPWDGPQPDDSFRAEICRPIVKARPVNFSEDLIRPARSVQDRNQPRRRSRAQRRGQRRS
jgi:tetratricopeptide (TPR) repeat protein